MIKNLLLAIFLIVTGLYAQTAQDVDNMISETKSKFAPDKRTVLFNIKYQIDGKNLTLEGETSSQEAKEYLLNLAGKSFSMTDNINLLPDESLNGKVYGIINLSVANIRSEPKHPAELATQGLLGTPVKVLKKENGWYYIQTPDLYLSWVDDEGVFPVTKNEYEAWAKAEKIIITSDMIYSYKDQDMERRVSDLVAGDMLKYSGEEGDFYSVEYPDGRKALVAKKDAMLFNEWFENRNPSAESVLTKAFSFMGMPYLWGGTSTKGMDCSGFTKTVYMLNGIILKRDASQQVYTGNLVTEEVDFDKLQPGDLLFFGFEGTKDKKERITHVGIYIGDTEFIHSSGMIKVNSLDSSRDNFSEFRYKTFIRAKRVLDSVNKNGIETFQTNKFYTGEVE